MNQETKQLTAQQLALYLGQQAEYTSHRGTNIQAIHPFDLEREEHGFKYTIKPLLRPLSDISEEELRDVFPGESNPEAYTTEFWKSHLKEYGVPTLKPEQFTYLLSRGFDLFNWIEQGLAVSKPAIGTPEI